MGPCNIEYKVAVTLMKKEGLVSDLSKEETINKNDSPNKLIIVKRSRSTDQNDKSCKKLFLYFVLYQKHCQRLFLTMFLI